MTKEELLNQMPEAHRQLAEQMLKIITRHDPGAHQGIANIMGSTMIGYKQRGEFKYGIASNKHYLSFHSMVMYCYPELHQKWSKQFGKAKFQKACINISDCESFPISLFEEFIKEGAAMRYPSLLQLSKQER